MVAEKMKARAGVLDAPLDILSLSVRSMNALAAAGVETVRDLVVMSERDLFKFPNLGRKSISEIEASLVGMGLVLGMALPVEVPVGEGRTLDRDDEAVRCKRLGQSLANAFAWYARLAETGCASAHNLLGYMYQTGRGTGKDPGLARHHYGVGARLGSRLAEGNLRQLEGVAGEPVLRMGADQSRFR